MWSAVTEWADRHHLRPHQNLWVPHHALLYISLWTRDWQSAQRLDIPKIPPLSPEAVDFDLAAGEFEFAVERWRFGSESWKQFEKRVEVELHKRLKSYRRAAERAAIHKSINKGT